MHRSVVFGFDEANFARGIKKPIAWREEFAPNGHMMVAGKTGTGKSFMLRRIVNQIAAPIAGREPVRVYNFNVHGDNNFPGESAVSFSEASFYGINPLRLSPNPEYGGVRKCVQSFIEILSDSTPGSPLGARQAPALRHILYDLFEQKGFKFSDPSSWSFDETVQGSTPLNGRVYLDVPYDEREMAKSAAKAEGLTLQFDGEARCWWSNEHRGRLERWPSRSHGRQPPTVPEAARFIAHRLQAMSVSGGSKTVRLLEEHNKKVVAWHKKIERLQAGGNRADVEEIQQDVREGAERLIETFTDYVLNIETGHELNDVARYESVKNLESLRDRMDNLVETGLFKPNMPRFDPSCPIWTYDVPTLSRSESQLLVWTELKRIYDSAKARGFVSGPSEVRDVILLDEAGKFFLDKESNIVNVIAQEGRKFGVSLICACQAPSEFSEAFLGNVGTKLILGLDHQYHASTVRKMGVAPEILQYVVGKKIAAIQVTDSRDEAHHFVKTRVAQ